MTGRFYPLSDRRREINNNTRRNKKEASDIIENSVRGRINVLKESLNKIPSIYNNMKNNFTRQYNTARKRNEIKMANTGTHTASGYALSKRSEIDANYNKGLNEISKDMEEKKESIYNNILREKEKGELSKRKANLYYDNKKEEALSKETERIDNLRNKRFEFLTNQDYLNNKLNKDFWLRNEEVYEKKRQNDESIKKTDNDILLKNDENRRKNEEHNINIKYLPQKFEKEIENMVLEGKLKNAKINNENASTYRLNHPVVKVTSGGSGKKTTSAGKTKETELDGKIIANMIANRIGRDISMEKNIRMSKEEIKKVKDLLKEYEVKYHLPAFVVNDARFYLNI